MERDLARAVLDNDALIAVTGDDRGARVALLDRAVAILEKNLCRIVRVESPAGAPLDLQRVMDQVVGRGQSGADRVERFFDTIALPVGDEQHIVLTIDDADLLTSDMLNYLALIGPTTVGQDLRLQIIFAGAAAMWDRLPRSGNLSAERIVTRFTTDLAPSAPTTSAPTPTASPPPEPAPEPTAAPTPPPVLPPAATPPARRKAEPAVAPEQGSEVVSFRRKAAGDRPAAAEEGHALLRQQLAQRERSRQRRQHLTSRVVGQIMSAAMLVVIIVATTILWVRLPELQAAVRQYVAPKLAQPALESHAVAALLDRGNRFLESGDIEAAQVVFAHAATAGSALGATGLGKTYDPRFLAEIGAHGFSPDPSLAAAWYQRAAALGDREANDRLSRMQASLGK